jgi:hypothetical protein
MDQHWRAASFHSGTLLVSTRSRKNVEVVVVVAGDGQVPHPAVVDGRDRPADDGGEDIVGGAETLTLSLACSMQPIGVDKVC